MAEIRYSAGKLLTLALVMGALAGFFLWVLIEPKTFMSVHGRYGWLVHFIARNALVSGGLFAAFAGVAVLAGATALGDRIALALGPDGIDLRTMLGRHRRGWGEVAKIGIDPANPLYGRAETLAVRVRRDDGGEKVLRISTGLLEQSRWQIERLLEGTGRPGIGTSVAPAAPGEAAPAMDYDAVIERHLAARQAAGGPPPVAAPRPSAGGGFGRKGL